MLYYNLKNFMRESYFFMDLTNFLISLSQTNERNKLK